MKLRTHLLPAILAVFICLSLFALSGCAGERPQNSDWATPTATGAAVTGGSNSEIQAALDTYAKALTDKDRAGFAGVLDNENPDFVAAELQRFDNLAAVPFGQFRLQLVSQSETAPGTIAAKIDSSYTLRDSFGELPDPRREAYFLVRRPDGWKLSGDASQQTLGKNRAARFEDFGKVEVIAGQRSLVLYHASQEGVARQVQEMTDAAMPRLESIFPDAGFPKVPLKVYDNKSEIDQTFPGKWQEWTGGASLMLGDKAEQGGEIIIDAEVFSRTDQTSPGYNQKMIAHELTHIALFPISGNRTPPFLVEGLADYVGGIEDISMLKDRLRGGGAISPTLSDIYQPGSFSALLSTDAATLAYEEADSAVALLETKYGNDKVMALLREFQRRQSDNQSQDALVNDVFTSVLGIGWNDFAGEWRGYVLGG
ncbi:MAG: gluzincin family metallopeptidase [Thermoleophilia bacterium]